MNLQLALDNVYGAKLLIKRRSDDRTRRRQPENTIFNDLYYNVPSSEQNNNYEIASFDSILNKLPMNTVFMYITVLPNDFPDFRALTIDNREPEISTNNGADGVKKVNTKDYPPPPKKMKSTEKRSIFKPLPKSSSPTDTKTIIINEEINEPPIQNIIIVDQPNTDFIDQAIGEYLSSVIVGLSDFRDQDTPDAISLYYDISPNILFRRIIDRYYPRLPRVDVLRAMFDEAVDNLDNVNKQTMIRNFGDIN